MGEDDDLGRILGLYDRQGARISYEEYARLLYEGQDGEYYRVDSTEIGAYWVSTVWLGQDHGFGRTAKPVIFETMVFLREGVAEDDERHLDHYTRRYSSEEDARAGHDDVVDMLREHYDARSATTSPENLETAPVEELGSLRDPSQSGLPRGSLSEP